MSQEILAHLASSDESDIRSAAFEAADKKLSAALPLLVKLVAHTSVGVQEAVDYALRQIRGSDTIEFLLPLLLSENVAERNIAMDVLREIGSDAPDLIIDYLINGDVDVRIFAADILGSSQSALGVQALCQALIYDPEVNVRYQAAVSLGKLTMPQSIRCLHKSLEDEEWVQFATIEALAKLRDASSVSALAGALDESTELVASMIIDALAEIGSVKAVPILYKHMEKASGPLQSKIVKAIINIIGTKTLTLLTPAEQERLFEHLLIAIKDDDDDVIDAAIRGLATFGGLRASEAIIEVSKKLDKDRDHLKITNITNSLCQIGINQALFDAVLNGTPTQAFIALTVMDSECNAEVLTFIRTVFATVDTDYQHIMAKTLGNNAEIEDEDFLINIVTTTNDIQIKKHLLLALGARLKSQKAEKILQEFLFHPSSEIREYALEACIAQGSPSMHKYFANLLASKETEKQCMGIYALGHLDAVQYESLINKHLTDDNEEVRVVATQALTTHLPITHERFAVMQHLLSDPASRVRLAMIEWIKELPLKDSQEYLFNALNDESDWVKVRAIESLEKHHSEECVPILVDLLKTSSPMISFKIIETLGRIGGTLAFNALLELLESDSMEIQEAASDALSHLSNAHGGDL